MTTTKKELVEQISKRLGLKKEQVFPVVDQTFAAMRDSLIQGDRIEIRGFGVFEVKDTKARTLPMPAAGKPSMVNVRGGRLFEGLPKRFEGGHYHSLYADLDTFPDALAITAESDEGIVMAVEHPELPVAAVQFHPESILSLDEGVGLAVVKNVMRGLAAPT